jgi:hypothetical protein
MKAKRAGSIAQDVKHLLSKHKMLSSNSSTAKLKKKSYISRDQKKRVKTEHWEEIFTYQLQKWSIQGWGVVQGPRFLPQH